MTIRVHGEPFNLPELEYRNIAMRALRGAGLKDEWVKHGLSVQNLPTHFGTLSYSIASSAPSSITIRLEGSIDARKSPLLLPVTLLSSSLTFAKVDSVLVQPSRGFVEVTHLPATVELGY